LRCPSGYHAVLAVNDALEDSRAACGGLRSLTAALRREAREAQAASPVPTREPIMKSTIGRPRKLTDRQVQVILAWHVRYLVWRAYSKTLKSQRQLARELGVSQSTVSRVARTGGLYKRDARGKGRLK
jgi:predicted DNA binding protein